MDSGKFQEFKMINEILFTISLCNEIIDDLIISNHIMIATDNII
jgi:hypothetical protein